MSLNNYFTCGTIEYCSSDSSAAGCKISWILWNTMRYYKMFFLYMVVTLSVFQMSGHFQDLTTALKGALSGSLEALILGLMRSTAQFDAAELNASIKVQNVFFCDWNKTCHWFHCTPNTWAVRYVGRDLSTWPLNMCVQGLGTDEETLIEILCSRSNKELVEIKKVYKDSKKPKTLIHSDRWRGNTHEYI